MNRDIRLRVEGAMLERLIQRCTLQGAVFARIERNGTREITLECDEHSAAIVTALCEKYHLNFRLLRKSGLPVLREKLRARRTLPAGLALCALICTLILSRLWLIDVRFTGANPGNEKEIHSGLESLGVRPGILTRNIDTDILQKQLLADFESYSHIGLKLQGTRLLVEAVSEVPAPEVYEIDLARDLVAAMDGIVCGVNVKSGSACVREGDIVRTGQLLIRGEEQKSKEETTAVSALGEVFVRSWYEGRAEGKLTEAQVCRTGRTSFSTQLKLMRSIFPLKTGEEFAQSESETEIIPIGGLFVPLELVRQMNHEMQTVSRPVDRDALKSQLSSLARADALSKLSQSGPDAYEITDYWEEFIIEDNTLRARAVYEITTDIAVTRDALIEEVYQTWKPADK